MSAMDYAAIIVIILILDKCKKYGRAISIGENHGSLFDRIMSYYGDFPSGLDGLGDTIWVSILEPPEEEIDPCRRLVNLGMQAAKFEKGVATFEERHHHYFNFQWRTSQLAIQKGDEVDYRGVLYHDGSVLMDCSCSAALVLLMVLIFLQRPSTRPPPKFKSRISPSAASSLASPSPPPPLILHISPSATSSVASPPPPLILL